MCGVLIVWPCVCVGMCMCGISDVWVCVCMGSAMWGCVYVWVLYSVGVFFVCFVMCGCVYV